MTTNVILSETKNP